ASPQSGDDGDDPVGSASAGGGVGRSRTGANHWKRPARSSPAAGFLIDVSTSLGRRVAMHEPFTLWLRRGPGPAPKGGATVGCRAMIDVPAAGGGPLTPAPLSGRQIVRPERVPVRAVWPSEATDFTPWLGDHLEFLDDLGIGRLDLVAVEAQLPGLARS